MEIHNYSWITLRNRNEIVRFFNKEHNTKHLLSNKGHNTKQRCSKGHNANRFRFLKMLIRNKLYGPVVFQVTTFRQCSHIPYTS